MDGGGGESSRFLFCFFLFFSFSSDRALPELEYEGDGCFYISQGLF